MSKFKVTADKIRLEGPFKDIVVDWYTYADSYDQAVDYINSLNRQSGDGTFIEVLTGHKCLLTNFIIEEV